MDEDRTPQGTDEAPAAPAVQTGDVENMTVEAGGPSQAEHGRRVVERAEETPTS